MKDLGEIYNKKNYIKFGESAKEHEKGKPTPIQLNEEETKKIESWEKDGVRHVFTAEDKTYSFVKDEGVPGNWRKVEN